MTYFTTYLGTRVNPPERLSNALALLALLALGFLASGGDVNGAREASASGSAKPATVISDHGDQSGGGVTADRKPRSRTHRELPRTQSV